MRSNKKKFLFVFLLVLVLIFCSVLFVKNYFVKVDPLDEIININSLSDKFMEDYYKGSEEIEKSKNRDNVLIIVSKKAPKNVYGAIRVVNAPNSTYILEYSSEMNKNKAMKKFKKNKDVYSIIENRKYKFTDDNSGDDKQYNSWGIKKAGLDNAIRIVNEKGGEKVTAAIIDTGCDIDLFNASYNGKIEEVHNLYQTSLYNHDVMFDHFGHGTHIAGTIAEGTPDNVKILPVKVSDESSMDTVVILEAINYITDNHKADVINMSFGATIGGDPDTDFSMDPEYVSIEAARRENIISVVAAGNDDTDEVDVPGSFDNVITISAVDENLDRAEFSNYGNQVDFAAPGVDILSINGVKSGTSMATPHAVSAVAFLKSLNKNLSFEATIDALKENSTDLGAKGKDVFFGNGFINFTDTKICDENSDEACTSLGINGEVVPTHMEVDEVVLTPYNYGSIFNILPTKIKLLDDNDKFDIKMIDELDDVNITGYSPYEEGEQTVNISYKNMNTTFKVTNPTNYEIGWEYRFSNDENGDSTDKYIITGYKDNGMGLKKIYFPKIINNVTVESIETEYPSSSIFNNSSDSPTFTEAYLPDTLKKIGMYTFRNCKNLYKIKSDAEYLSVGPHSLSDLPYLTTVDAVIHLYNSSYSVFSNDISLKEVNISSNTTVIPGSVFENCISLKNINIPNGVTEIGHYAFNRSGLTSINLPSGIKKIDKDAFSDSRIKHLFIPKSLTSIGENAFGIDSLETIDVDEENPTYDSRDDCNCIVESSDNILIRGSNNSVIPKGVKRVENLAFYKSKIENIKIPDSVKSIGNKAFFDADYLGTITIPRSVTSIGEECFVWAGWYSQLHTPVFNVYSSSYAHEYVVANDNTYILLDKTPNIPKIEGALFYGPHYQYLPFEQADLSGNRVEIKFDGIDEIETITQFKKIVYKDGRDSFRYGDWSYELYFDSKYGYYNLHGSWMVDIGKKTPEYEIPTDIYANRNSTLADVDLPEGFEWEDSSIQLTELGDKVYDARFIPEDTQNYETIDDIAITVHVIDKTLIKPTITAQDKTYDGTKNLSEDNIEISGIDENDYSIESVSLNDSNAGLRKALVRLKLKDEKFETHSFSNGKQEKVFKCDINILPEKLNYPQLADKRYIYDGTYQSADLIGYNNKKMAISGNRQKNAGIYYIEFYLKNDNYVWFDGYSYPYMLPFTIEKADIEYYSEDKICTYDGMEHGLDSYPVYYAGAQIKYMDDHGNYTLDEPPKYTEPGVYITKYMITVDNNYKVKYGENTLTITADTIINNTQDYVTLYDGLDHSISLDLNIGNYTVHYSIDNTDYDLDKLPKFKDVGEYTINYKIDADGYDSITGSNKVKIYGIKKFDTSLLLKNNVLITRTNSFNNLSNKIITYSTSTVFKHFNFNNELLENGNISTGDKIGVSINGSKDYNYSIALLGDINGDGIINSADLFKIRQHLLNSIQLKDENGYAADINNDGIINSADLFKIRQHLLGISSIIEN